MRAVSSVSLQGGDPIAVSGAGGAELDDELKRIDGLQRAWIITD